MTIIYEPHPVTTERKAELLAQGYKILDARFEPVDATVADEGRADAVHTESPNRGRKAKA